MDVKKTINVAESILLVSSFFMFIYIFKEIIVINNFNEIFELDTLWFVFPIVALVLSVSSYLRRAEWMFIRKKYILI